MVARHVANPVCIAALLLLSATFVVGMESAAQPKTAHGHNQSTAPVTPFTSAACDASDALSLIGKDGVLQTKPDVAAMMFRARIATCNQIIKKYIEALPPEAPSIAQLPAGMAALPTPTPRPVAPSGCSAGGIGHDTSDERLKLYSVLTFCTAWIARNIPSPTPATATPQPIALHGPDTQSSQPWTKIIYILATASDASVSAQIALQFANDLRSPRIQPTPSPGAPTKVLKDVYTGIPVKYIVMAEPSWTVQQYQQQCFNDPSTAGAIVAVQPGSQTSSFNLLYSTSWTALSLQAMIVDCEPTNTAYTNGASYVVALSHVRTGTGKRVSFSLSTALGFLAGILAVHPNRTSSYAVVAPSPLPSPGGSYQTGYSVGSNQGLSAAAAVGVAALTPLASTNFGQGASIDAQVAGGMAIALPGLIDDLMTPCNYDDHEPNSTIPMPQCQWFGYRPPSPLVVSPTSLTFTQIGQQLDGVVSDQGTSTWTASSSNPLVATVAHGSNAKTFDVTSVGAGSCSIEIVDAIGLVVKVSVMVP